MLTDLNQFIHTEKKDRENTNLLPSYPPQTPRGKKIKEDKIQDLKNQQEEPVQPAGLSDSTIKHPSTVMLQYSTFEKWKQGPKSLHKKTWHEWGKPQGKLKEANRVRNESKKSHDETESIQTP